MAISRVTHQMMTQRAGANLQNNLQRLAEIQEHLSTGRRINRPSDSPTDASTAMRLRSSLADHHQYVRNAEDGLGWLGQIDSTLQGMSTAVRRAYELALKGANTGSMGEQSREALAQEIDQIREGLIDSANTTYLDRPVFGGLTPGSAAYAPDGTFVGTPGSVERTVADGVTIRVDVDAAATFGPDGASVFDVLAELSAALRANDADGIAQGVDATKAAFDRITASLSEVGLRYARVDQAAQSARDAVIDLTSSLSGVESADLPSTLVELQMQEVAYQAALAATARVLQPSLVSFLR